MLKLPFARSDGALAYSDVYRRLIVESPITRVLTMTGDEAWLVTGYHAVKELSRNTALRRSHVNPDEAAKSNSSVVQGGPTEEYDGELERHKKMRAILSPAFSARRTQELAGAVGKHVVDIVDDFTSPPVELHKLLSSRLPAIVICELLGADVDDAPLFTSWTSKLAGLGDVGDAQRAQQEFVTYVAQLLERKRADPGEDLFSDLAASDVPVGEAIGIAGTVLFAGNETTGSRIDLGMMLFDSVPAQWQRLVEQPELVSGAVEEILRLSVTNIQDTGGVIRYAAEPIEIGGEVIAQGDGVLLAFHAANRDPSVFTDPDTFSIARDPNPHLAFGHGMRHCIGASLARIELAAAFGTLAKRLPSLCVDRDQGDVLRTSNSITGSGIEQLYVTW